MTDFVTIEPARERAPALAVFLLAMDGSILTVSGGGFLVPLDMYPLVPPELLAGAYVDGYAYDRPSPQPAPAKPAAKRPAPRKRAPRKPKAPATPEADEVPLVELRIPVTSAQKDDVNIKPDAEVTE